MSEPLPTNETGEGIGGSNGDGAAHRDAPRGEGETVPASPMTSRLLQGPVIASPKSRESPPPAPEFRAAFSPADQHEARMATCRGVQATVVDFFVGVSEQRIQVNASVYDLIYGSGPHAIMNAAMGQQLTDGESTSSFRWYHLPANNLEWVEHLLGRHMSQDNHETRLPEEMKRKLGLSRHQHRRTKAGRLSFKRPGTIRYATQTDADAADGDAVDYIFSVIPFLHFDTEEAFDGMTRALDDALDGKPGRNSAEPEMPPPTETAQRTSQASNAETQWPESVARLLQPESNNRPRLSPRQIQRRLLADYIGSGNVGEAPRLQPRRTLDQYFYTHLGSTRQRDKDQVVLRYTYRTPETEPKLFMVDQLWLWVISDQAIISCLPTTWPSDVDATRPRNGDRRKSAASIIRGFATTSKGRKKQIGRHRGPSSSGNQRRPSISSKFDGDLLDIHKRLLAHLSSSRRAPVTSVFQLAHTITTFCIDTFDPHRVPEDYQFLDFFERSIGNVRDECARQLQRFCPTGASPGKDPLGDSFGTEENVSIELETQQFVEIEDIRDELSILQLVLEDQREVLQQMDAAMAEDKTRPAPLAQNHVLEGHLRRIKKMEAMATRTSQLMYHLIDLKQKQASVLEALAMRNQADILARHAEEGAIQAKEAQEQTAEAIKQGRTVLLFTVVAIVFLPLSFLAAFFAIEIDAFPVDENGKLELGYVLTYMLSISAGLSIPFIFIVFNQDRFWGWLRRLRIFALGMPLSVWLVLFLMGILMGTIWGLGLDRTVKISITIPLVILGVMSIITFWLYKIASNARKRLQGSVSDSDASYSVSRTIQSLSY
ncbi:hypothetical protein QBC34DRAFT_356004 [Podospora aff. communis PSN243]|uniref:Ankyrin repeat protein n=1 Tax=Podospora aff. communis PSN243 TaxID=3040156 RepID=A0AAV9GF88_9PEZI|nr:hypothetical protein QBC34DRAFT_356004 [Podospora aff. communis PSN243]